MLASRTRLPRGEPDLGTGHPPRRMMEVLVAPKAGFCFGVKRAVKLAEKTVATATGPVFTLGQLIHNPEVVGCLAARGVRIVGHPSAAAAGTLIIRSHGVPPGMLSEARRLGLTVVDATCPFVRKAQELAAHLAGSGYQVLVAGDPAHPEIEAVVAAAGKALVVRDADDIEPARLRRRVGLICQTTLAPGPLARVAAAIAPLCRELVVHNTICTATYDRQRAALELAGQVDVMVVVGGRDSANTAHLAEICRELVPTHHVERAGELDPDWFTGCGRVGITAGASTPAEQIQMVQERLQEMSQEGN